MAITLANYEFGTGAIHHRPRQRVGFIDATGPTEPSPYRLLHHLAGFQITARARRSIVSKTEWNEKFGGAPE